MVSFKLSGIEYKTPANNKEISIGNFVKFLRTILQTIPPELEEVYNFDKEQGETPEGKWKALTKDEKKTCYEYFAKVVSYWTGADENQLKSKDGIFLPLLEAAYWDIEFTLLNFEPDESFVGFEAGGVEYLLPAEHMRESTFIEFAEAAQFESSFQDLKSGSYIAILDIMAVLCRPAGEEYDDKNNAKRKKLFSSLSLDVAINVAFFFLRLKGILRQNILIYTLLTYPTRRTQKKSA